jgi:hypothetical protein
VAVAKIEAKYLLIHIAIKVERLYADVRSVQPTLEARPEVLDPVGVDVIPNIAFDVVDDLVDVLVFGRDEGKIPVNSRVNQKNGSSP